MNQFILQMVENVSQICQNALKQHAICMSWIFLHSGAIVGREMAIFGLLETTGYDPALLHIGMSVFQRGYLLRCLTLKLSFG